MLKSKNLKALLILTIIEGLLGVIYLFSIPSMDRNAGLFGYSTSRLLVGAVSIFLLLCLGGFFLLSILKRDRFERQTDSLNEFLLAKNYLLPVTIGLLFSFIVGIGVLILNSSPAAVHLNNLKFVIDRILGLLIWGLAAILQMLILLIVTYFPLYREKRFYDLGTIYKTILLSLVIICSVFHWLILYFKIQLFASIPYWTWFFHEKTGTRDFIFIPLLLFSLFVVLLVMKHPKRRIINLVLLVFLGYVIQIGFGFIEGEGFESIRTKAAEAGHVVYFEYAVDNPVLSHAILNYEEAYGWETWLGTKPPGVILFYIVSQKISNIINPVQDYAGRFMRLTNFAAYIYPLLTYLAIIPLFYLTKAILGSDEKAYVSSILYMFFPNIVLMPLELDQVLFPLLFIICLLCTWQIIKKQSFFWAALTGIVYYISLYFTFSLLPLLALICMWLFFEFLNSTKKQRFKQLVIQGAGIAVGLVIGYGFFNLVLNYDVFIRFSNAMAHHTTLKEYESGLQQILAALKLNNLEIAAWIGFPMALFVVSRIFSTVKSYISRNISRADIFSAAMIVMYIFLNIVGRTRGEVGRLWIFLIPAFAVMVSQEISCLFNKRKKGVLLTVALLQMITTMMTFKMQDYF